MPAALLHTVRSAQTRSEVVVGAVNWYCASVLHVVLVSRADMKTSHAHNQAHATRNDANFK